MIGEAEILSALKTATGCDIAQVGEATLRKRIRLFLADCTDPEHLLDQQRDEWRALLHAVLVPETWFFRNPEAFDAFAVWSRETDSAKRPLRILSLPCATGEEPYSIAMTLLDAGWSPEKFQITAGDIGTHFLNQAIEGNYTRNAFRGFDETRYGHFFESMPNKCRRLKDGVRKLVRFRQLNLIDGELPDADVVFCRNALIYLDSTGQNLALKRIHALLPADGALFLGPVEPPLALRCGFSVLPYPMAFACCKTTFPAISRSVALPAASKASAKFAEKSRSRVNRHRRVTFTRTAASAPDMAAPKQLALPSFEEIRELADRGELSEAAELLNRFAAADIAPSAELYCLSGIIHEVGGRHETAERFYRKALFLDPDHTESLLHLSLLLDISGRHAAANTFRQRLKRQQTS